MSKKVWKGILDSIGTPSNQQPLYHYQFKAQDWHSCALSDFVDLRAEFPNLWDRKIQIRNSHIDERFGNHILTLGVKFYTAVINNKLDHARHLYVVLGQAIAARSKKVAA